MSLPRNGINGGHYYSNLISPIEVDLNFVVDSTNGNGLGLRSLKSNGFVKNVFMNTSAGAPAGTPAFGSARTYGILAASAISNTGNTVVSGNLGLTPGSSITGFPPGTFTGVENVDNPAAVAAKASAQTAYTDLQSRSATTIATELGGQTLAAGVYHAASGTFTLNGTLTLTGSATDVYVFRTDTTLITGATSPPVIALGAVLPQNIYWAVGSSATINSANSGTLSGNVIAQVSITDTLGGTVNGTLAALTGAVTLSAAAAINTVPLVGTAAAGSPNPSPGFALIQFNSNYNKYIGGFSGYVSPLSGTNIAINSTNLTKGQAYVITSVGTSTLADWQAIGLMAGLTPTAGQAFIAIKSGNGAGSGQVQVPKVSGVNSIEVIGDPNLEIANSNIAQNGGAYLLVQFLSNGVLTPPVDGSVVGMSAIFDQSSVTVDGL